jgi:alginate O-acetyltransferase complex protein AlgI
MLFNSLEFLLVFLPLTLTGFYLLGTWSDRRIYIICISVLFYSYWDWRLTPVLIGSLTCNYLIAYLYTRFRNDWIIGFGVAANLASLGYFKYADFFADQYAFLVRRVHVPLNHVLPLGISFFTFQAIVYLVDLSRGNARLYTWREFGAYISFFPHLIAGPIVRHDELVPQFALSPSRDGVYERLGRGALLLLFGLAKKIIIADPAALISDAGFGAASSLSCQEAWVAALAFSIQIYFDFSGYSDMAIGIAQMFGIRFPFNFDAPYRSITIAEFWRRWHITLSRLLRDYVYIPLGGSRHGLPRQMVALVATMLLGGLWHGAGWTFVAWGALHGCALAVHHLWRRANLALPTFVGWILTLAVVISGWVLFRAASFPVALAMFKAMLGLQAGTGAVVQITNFTVAGLITAALIAVVGPTSQELALDRFKPRLWYGFAAGAALTAVILQMAEGQYVQFIYFKF